MREVVRKYQIHLMLFMGVALSLLVFQYINEQHKFDKKRHFKTAAAENIAAIEHKLLSDITVLKAVVGFYDASENIKRGAFSSFVRQTSNTSLNKSFRSLLWVPAVPFDQREKYEQQAREDGFGEFAFSELGADGRSVKARQRPVYYPVFYIEPYEGNELYLGFDLASDPARNIIMEKARDSGELVASGKTTAVNLRDGSADFLLFYPVYSSNAKTLHTIEERRKNFRGFVVGVVNVATLVSSAFKVKQFTDSSEALVLYIYDLNDLSSNVSLYVNNVMSDSLLSSTLSMEDARIGLFYENTISFGDRQWLFVARPLSADSISQIPLLHWVVLSLGLLMTGVFCIYLSNVSARARIIKSLVEKRTHELADREAHLEAIVDTAVDGIITIDRAGIVKSFNAAAERMFGYSPAEVIGRNVSMLMPNEYADHHDQYLVNYLTTGIQKIIGSGREVVALRKDGSVFPMELAVSEFSTSNEGLMFTGLVRDISERKLAENEVRKSETRFRVMLESAADAIYLHDSNGRIIDVNNQACEMLGYSKDELLCKSVFEIDPQMTQEELSKLWMNSDKTKFPVSITTKHCRKNGEIFTVEVKIGLASFSGDTFSGDTLFVAIARDITERERSQSELSRANRQLYLLSQCNAAIVNSYTEEELLEKICEIIVNADQKKLAWAGYANNDVNKTVQPIVHYGFDQGYLDSISVTWADAPNGQGPAGLAIRTAKPVVVNDIYTDPRFEAWRKEGMARGYASCVGLPLVESGKSFGVIMVYAEEVDCFNDKNINILMQVADNASVGIQARRSYAAMLQSRLEADKANRAKSEFLSSMSHELRTPMNAVLGFGQLLELDLEDEQHLQNVKEILRAGEHLLTLINEILDLAKIESGCVVLSMESVLVSDVLKDCIALVDPLAKKQKIEIRNEVEVDASYKVKVDFTRFKQVVLNLLSNAVKYNREGGEVSVDCKVVGHRLRISVSDTGIGMTKDQLQQLFRPFERVGAEKTAIEGTGIGLVITRNLVELMSGSIGVESREGAGSTFWIELDNISDEDSLPVKEKLSELAVVKNSDSLSYAGKNILYIEDNPVNVRLIEKALGNGNFNIVSAPDALLGIRLAETTQPDLILLDINLPGMDGFQAMKRLKELDSTRHIPVVAISANAMSGDIEKGMKAGFVKYITKPVDVKELLSVVGAVVQG